MAWTKLFPYSFSADYASLPSNLVDSPWGLSKCKGPFCVGVIDLQKGLANRGGYLPDFTVLKRVPLGFLGAEFDKEFQNLTKILVQSIE